MHDKLLFVNVRNVEKIRVDSFRNALTKMGHVKEGMKLKASSYKNSYLNIGSIHF